MIKTRASGRKFFNLIDKFKYFYNKLMDSLGVHWMPLKVNLLPFIIKEVDNVVEKYYGNLIRVEKSLI